MKLITLEGLKEFWNGFKENLSRVAFSGDYNDLRNKPAISSLPDSIKNPYAFQANGKTYDGAEAVNMGTVGLAYGGTGAVSAAAARTNLGLGAAATQGIANNLTTTAAGAVLDARQGTALKQDVDKINGSLQDTSSILIAALEKKVVVHGRYNIDLQIAYGCLNVQFVANQEKVLFISYENGFAFPTGCFAVIPILHGTASEKYEVSVQGFWNNGFNLMYNCQGVSNAAQLEVNYIAFGF